MRIITVNLKRIRNITRISCILVVLIVLLSGAIGFISKIMRRDDTSLTDTTPYEKIVIIDAGHGGEDSGAVGVSGVLEKDLNLDIALTLGRILEERGYIPVYTRLDDRLLYKDEENIKGIRKISDLKNRCSFASNYSDSLFVSIHMNSFGDEKYSGLQVYYSESHGSSLAAELVQASVKELLQPSNNRKIKSGKKIYVLENTENPAILIECGFITNKEECKKLENADYREKLASAIADGIIKYLEK